ncbi:hypothetical protein ILP97_44680 [Amycolatopsis sp. H6(2020)]|nr:hypothetical protein [Amycolatopsis sp. H6(2020)]
MPDEETSESDHPSGVPTADDTNQPDTTSEDRPSPPPPAPKTEKRSDRSLAITSVIASALVGLGGIFGTVIASQLSIDASIRNQDQQSNEARAKEDRESRKDAYFEFLKAANTFGMNTADALPCFAMNIERNRLRGQAPPSEARCQEELTKLNSSIPDFYAARNKVFIYGSAEAEEQAEAISNYLPSTNPLGPQLPAQNSPPIHPFIFDQFRKLYVKFENVACKEIPAEPRESCK